MGRKILSLDIRHDAVTAVLLATGIKGPWVERHHRVPITDAEEPGQETAKALDQVMQQLDADDATCVVSLPADRFSFRNIQVPFREKRKVDQILRFELEPVLPAPVDTQIIDYQAFHSLNQTDLNHVMAASIDATTLNVYADMLAARNLHPRTITVGGCALARCMDRFADVPDTWMMLDMGGREASLIGVLAGRICFVRPLLGYRDGPHSAEAVGRMVGHTLAGLDDLYHLAFSPECLWVADSGLGKTDLIEKLSALFPFPVKRVDILSHVKTVPDGHQPLPGDAPFLDSPIALALSEAEGLTNLNFRKGHLSEVSFWMANKQRLIRTGILAGLALVLFAGYYLVDAYHTRQRIERLDEAIVETFKSTFPGTKTIVDPLRQMRAELREIKKSAFLATDAGNTIRVIDLLHDISKGIPQETDVQFTRLVIGDGMVQITGDTDTFNAVDGMKNRLEKVRAFNAVTITSANMEKSGNRVRFKLKVEI